MEKLNESIMKNLKEFEEDEEFEEREFTVVVSFGNAEHTYTVYAENEEDAEMYALDEAKEDLYVVSVE